MDIRRVGLAHPDAVRLVAALQEQYTSMYGVPDETHADAAGFEPPRGAFFVGYLDDVPVASGGWRFRGDLAAFGTSPVTEVKRMYVVPQARGQGLGRRMLEHLERTAREAGSPAMVLETGTRQPEAIALYRSRGYTRYRRYGRYRWSPTARYFAKLLLDVPGRRRGPGRRGIRRRGSAPGAAS